MPIEPLLDLVEAVHQAASSNGDWRTFLQQLTQIVGGCVLPGLFVTLRGSKASFFAAEIEPDPAWKRAFDEHFIRLDVRRPLIQALPQGSVFVGQRLLPDREFVRTEFYNDFLRPQGLFHIAGGVPINDQCRVVVLRVIRRRRDRPFAPRELRPIHLLLPHLRQALLLGEELFAARAQATAQMDVLDRFAAGVLTVAKSGRVLALNQAARAIIARKDGLCLNAQGHLEAFRPSADQHLQRAISAALAPPLAGDTPSQPLCLARPSGRRPLALLVAPVRSARFRDMVDGAQAIVFVMDPEIRLAPPVQHVCMHLGVTPAEAKLLIALAQGKSVASAAEELEISVHTARTQLKAALSKTAARRQGELIRLVLMSSAWLGTTHCTQDTIVSVPDRHRPPASSPFAARR
jgi:DNA-binding CsgD family transcriptional regulator